MSSGRPMPRDRIGPSGTTYTHVNALNACKTWAKSVLLPYLRILIRPHTWIKHIRRADARGSAGSCFRRCVFLYNHLDLMPLATICAEALASLNIKLTRDVTELPTLDQIPVRPQFWGSFRLLIQPDSSVVRWLASSARGVVGSNPATTTDFSVGHGIGTHSDFHSPLGPN